MWVEALEIAEFAQFAVETRLGVVVLPGCEAARWARADGFDATEEWKTLAELAIALDEVVSFVQHSGTGSPVGAGLYNNTKTNVVKLQ